MTPPPEQPNAKTLGELACEVATTLFALPFHVLDGPPNAAAPRARAMAIDLNGQPQLTLLLAWDEPSGRHLCGLMFACSPEEADPSMVQDALGELLNILAGQVKSLLALDHKLGLPRPCETPAPEAYRPSPAAPGVWLATHDHAAKVWIQALHNDSP